MTRQVSQYEIFVRMVEAMDGGNISQLRKADRLIRKTLSANKTNQDVSNGVFNLTEKEVSVFDALQRCTG